MASESPAWEEFKAAEGAPNGRCVVCDRKLRPPRRFLCGSADCARVFHATYKRGLRHKLRPELRGQARASQLALMVALSAAAAGVFVAAAHMLLGGAP